MNRISGEVNSNANILNLLGSSIVNVVLITNATKQHIKIVQKATVGNIMLRRDGVERDDAVEEQAVCQRVGEELHLALLVVGACSALRDVRGVELEEGEIEQLKEDENLKIEKVEKVEKVYFYFYLV